MKNKIVLLSLIYLALFYLPAIGENESQDEKRLYLHEVKFFNITDRLIDFHVADFDADGEDEFLAVGKGANGSAISDFNSEVFFAPMQADIRSPYWTNRIIPIEADTLPGWEYARFLRDLDGDSAWIEIRSPSRGKDLCRTEAICGTNLDDRKAADWSGQLWDGMIDACLAAQLDDDPEVELVVSSAVGYDCYPRGLFVYDYPSGRLKWKFLTGGNLGDIQLADADGDGLHEIYARSYINGNACEQLSGISDKLSTVLAIDHNGHVIWRDDLEDNFSIHVGQMLLCDSDNDGNPEIYYCRIKPLDGKKDFDHHIRVLEKHNALDGKLLAKRGFLPNEGFSIINCADLDQDGRYELVISDSVSMLDADSLVRIKSAGLRYFAVKAIADINPDPDGIPEIIAVSGDSLIILNNDLEKICVRTLDKRYLIIQAKAFRAPFGKSYIGVIMSRDELVSAERDFRFKAFEINSNPPLSGQAGIFGKSFNWPVIASVFFLGLLGGMVSFLVISKKAARTRKRSKNLEYDKLLSVLITFDHGQMAGKNLNRIALLFGNFPEEKNAAEELIPRLKSAVESYNSYTKGQLDNLINHGKQFREFNSNLGVLVRARGRLDKIVNSESATSASHKAVPDIVDEIKTRIREIRAGIHKHFACDSLKTVTYVLNALNGSLDEYKINIEDFRTSGDVRKKVLFAEEELESVLEELINNSCSAMSGIDKKMLRFDLEFMDSRVILRIKDSGSGIPVDNPEKLFERGYSTKSGEGGYGLWYIRQTVNRYGGKITINNRKDASGAEITMILKVVEDG